MEYIESASACFHPSDNRAAASRNGCDSQKAKTNQSINPLKTQIWYAMIQKRDIVTAKRL